MIPKYCTPEISEWMNVINSEDCRIDASTMKVYIPVIMLDVEPSTTHYIAGINNSIFVSKEKIQTSLKVTCMNYIPVAISPLFRLLYAADYVMPAGTKVKVYAPNLDLHNAVVVPL